MNRIWHGITEMSHRNNDRSENIYNLSSSVCPIERTYPVAVVVVATEFLNPRDARVLDCLLSSKPPHHQNTGIRGYLQERPAASFFVVLSCSPRCDTFWCFRHLFPLCSGLALQRDQSVPQISTFCGGEMRQRARPLFCQLHRKIPRHAFMLLYALGR